MDVVSPSDRGCSLLIRGHDRGNSVGNPLATMFGKLNLIGNKAKQASPAQAPAPVQQSPRPAAPSSSNGVQPQHMSIEAMFMQAQSLLDKLRSAQVCHLDGVDPSCRELAARTSVLLCES